MKSIQSRSTKPPWLRFNAVRPSTIPDRCSQSLGRKCALDLAARSLPVAELSFLPAAQADYEEALAWYQARSVRAADGFEAAIANGVQRISDQPDFYALIDK